MANIDQRLRDFVDNEMSDEYDHFKQYPVEYLYEKDGYRYYKIVIRANPSRVRSKVLDILHLRTDIDTIQLQSPNYEWEVVWERLTFKKVKKWFSSIKKTIALKFSLLRKQSGKTLH